MSYGYEQVRYEVKYPVRFAQGTKLLADLAPFHVPDPHGKNGQYAVYSVYFDTRRLNSYRDKIDGFAGRIKFRLRTYLGKANPVWFLESEERIRHYIAKHRACRSPTGHQIGDGYSVWGVRPVRRHLLPPQRFHL